MTSILLEDKSIENFEKALKKTEKTSQAIILVCHENNDEAIEEQLVVLDHELLIGALSIGEIANNKDHYLELYNSTAVVARIADV